MVVIGEWAFTATLAVCLALMWRQGVLRGTEIFAAVVFAALVIVKLVAVIAALRSRATVRRLYAIPHRLANRLRRQPPPADTTAADEFEEAIAFVRARRTALTPLVLHGLGVELLGALELWAVLHALGYGTPVEALVTYCIGVLFAIVGFLPGGLGFVEASTLVSFGMPGPVAATATVLYRVCEMWLPVALGGVLWAWTARRASTA